MEQHRPDSERSIAPGSSPRTEVRGTVAPQPSTAQPSTAQPAGAAQSSGAGEPNAAAGADSAAPPAHEVRGTLAGAPPARPLKQGPLRLSGGLKQGREPISGYRLDTFLGRGQYGEVWSAQAPGGLIKAIKFVYGYFDDARAARELKALDRIKQVRHPFLLSLERFEVVDGQLVIVTELADMSLKDRFEQAVKERTTELENALAAQTALLHEVDHRVKNNLQMISSLIIMQSRSIPDESIRASLRWVDRHTLHRHPLPAH